MIKNIVIGVIGLVALTGLVAGMSGPSASEVQSFVQASVQAAAEKFGALAGPEVTSYLNVHGYFVQGGGRTAIDPVDNTYTLTFADMQNNNLLTFVASSTQPALTVTFPASSTFPLPETKGASRSWVIENPFTAAATTTTIAAGTGIDLQEPDGQNVVIGINNYAFVNCIRGADSGAPEDIVCSIDETIPAD